MVLSRTRRCGWLFFGDDVRMNGFHPERSAVTRTILGFLGFARQANENATRPGPALEPTLWFANGTEQVSRRDAGNEG